MISASHLAKYLIYLLKQQLGETNIEDFDVTPLKLQKLLYYCQGYSLALTGKTIFNEIIEAWKYGPVVNSVYQEYKQYQGGILPLDINQNFDDINDTVKSIAQLVVSEKGLLSAYALKDATHNEMPWKQKYDTQNYYHNEPITQESLRNFFAEKFINWEENYDDYDDVWETHGEPATKKELEAILEII